MPALKLVPMPPPEEVVVREEQPTTGPTERTPPPRLSAFPWQKGRKPSLCFDDVRGVTVVVRFVVPKAKKAPKPQPTDKRGGYGRFGASARKADSRYQYSLSKMAPPRDRRLEETRLRQKERDEMEADIAELTAAGAYDERPARGNGISGDCPTGPCGYLFCRHNLLITIRDSGSVKPRTRDLDPSLGTCSLKEAEAQRAKGVPMPFEELGPKVGVNAQRAEQIVNGALRKLKRAGLLDVFRQEGKG